MFDVTMGSCDGAETCELIGLHIRSLIGPKFRNQVGRSEGNLKNKTRSQQCI